MILQPIVENSIKHGFENIEGGGLITITGYRDYNDDIIFMVEDNGQGLDFDPLKPSQDNKGYGIINVLKLRTLKKLKYVENQAFI